MTLPVPLPHPQQYMIDHERRLREEAVYASGEYVMFTMLWTAKDHAAALVDRCPVCFVPQGRIANAYKQSSKANCVPCLGTSFEGGFRAQIVRPAILIVTPKVDHQDKRGQVERQSANLTTVADFWLRSGDFVYRVDGTRWEVSETGGEDSRLITGFNPLLSDSAIGGAYYLSRMDESTVAYKADPQASELATLLRPIDPHVQVDFSAVESIRGYLVPPG